MDTYITETKTVPLTEQFEHPMKDFLKKAGLDVSKFPQMDFIFESDDPNIRTGRHYLPIRLPAQPGWVFETFFRVTRMTEVPHASAHGHRTFIQVEWEILEAPIVDETPHLALSFLGGESICSRCREIFTVDAEVKNETTVQVKCPNCLAAWSIQASKENYLEDETSFLLDHFHRSPTAFQKKIQKWRDGATGPEDNEYYQFFPVQFEPWTETSSLELLFENRTGWITFSNGRVSGVESLFRSFINSLSLTFLTSQKRSETSELESTEIQRKSEITIQTKTQTTTTKRPRRTQEFRPITEVQPDISWEPRKVPEGPAVVESTKTSRSSKRRWIKRASYYAAACASIVFFSLIAWSYVTSTKTGSDDSQAQMAAPVLPSAPEPNETPPTVSTDTVLTAVEEDTTAEESRTEEVVPEDTLVMAAKTSNPERTRDISAQQEPSEKIDEEIKAELKQEAAELAEAEEEARRKREEEAQKRAEARALQEKVEAGYQQGMLHLKLQQAKKAAEEFERVIELDPKHVDTYRHLGLAYVYDHRFEKAVTAFETYLSLAGDTKDRDTVLELIDGLKSR